MQLYRWVIILYIILHYRAVISLGNYTVYYTVCSLCFLPAVLATEKSCAVKKPIRAELNIEPNCEKVNQSRAQHSYS